MVIRSRAAALLFVPFLLLLLPDLMKIKEPRGASSLINGHLLLLLVAGAQSPEAESEVSLPLHSPTSEGDANRQRLEERKVEEEKTIISGLRRVIQP